MTITSPPIVSLQAPKDVSIEEIEAELRAIWQNNGSDGEGAPATRATTFSFLVYEPDGTQHLLTALGFYAGPIDGIVGPQTVGAIRIAQKAYGVEVTGKSSPQFINLLQEKFAQAKEEDKLTEENKTAAISYSPELQGVGVADAIASSNPCRIITLCPIAGEDQGVKAQVSAYCPIQKRSQSTLVCCEYIMLQGTAEALARIGGIISELMISDLPKFVWWKATISPNHDLFKRLITNSQSLIIDSSSFNSPEAELFQVGELLKQGLAIADLNWRRLSPWQELIAEAFDPPERRAAIPEIDQITIDYEKGNESQALMFLGWITSRLGGSPIEYTKEGGDYDIRKIKFSAENNRIIQAELAAIPTADWGDIPGDLISLRLNSTNSQADCCTVLCSGTTGCMRMEAGGGAQSCMIEQVTSLSDQKTEDLLGRQLQRWGRDLLYEESMAITHQIIQLIQRKDSRL